MFFHDTAAGSFWRVFEYYDHTRSFTLDNGESVFRMAQTYGRFAGALRDFPAPQLHEVITGFHHPGKRLRDWKTALEADAAGRVNEIRELGLLDAMAEIEARLCVFGEWLNSGALPLRVVHNDTKADNILTDRHTGEMVAVIDLDTVMPGSILTDFGDMVRSLTPNIDENNPDISGMKFQMNIYEQLKNGYTQAIESWATDFELSRLHHGAVWIIGEQALRFLTDYIAGDVYYKTAYPRHNLDRALNQLALWRLLPF